MGTHLGMRSAWLLVRSLWSWLRRTLCLPVAALALALLADQRTSKQKIALEGVGFGRRPLCGGIAEPMRASSRSLQAASHFLGGTMTHSGIYANGAGALVGMFAAIVLVATVVLGSLFLSGDFAKRISMNAEAQKTELAAAGDR
jgi:hypothetical protein